MRRRSRLSPVVCVLSLVFLSSSCTRRAFATTTFSTLTNLGSGSGGSCPTAGSSTPTSIAIKGSGSGPAGNPGKQAVDNYVLCSSIFSSNFTLTAHIASLGSGVKAGMQIRDTLADDSANEMIYTVGGSTLSPSTDRRMYDGSPNLSIDRLAWGANPPALDYAPTKGLWMKLTRYGTEISIYYSSDDPNNPGQPLHWWAASEVAPLMALGSPSVGFVVSGTSGSVTFDSITISTTLDTVTNPTPGLSYTTSYLGNGYPGGGGNFMIYRGQALATDPSNDVYVQGQGEVESAISIDTNANWIAYYSGSHYNTLPGVAYTCGLVFSAQLTGIGWYDPKGQLEGTIGSSTSYYGLAAEPTQTGTCKLYGLEYNPGGNPAYTNTIDVFTISSGTPSANPTSTFPLQNVTQATAIAYDKTSPGYLWALKVDGTTTHGQKFDLSGTEVGSEIVGLTGPVGLALDTYGNVYITDFAATDQRVHIFTNAGAYKGVLGLTGGPHAESIPGTIANDSLDHPEGIALDQQNNLYVASSGPATPVTGPDTNFGNTGMTLRKYTPNSGGSTPTVTSIGTSNLAWQKTGLEYVDGASPDPASTGDVYTKFHHYKVTYSNMAVTYQGELVNDTDFPKDQRLLDPGNFRDAGSYIRTINSHKLQMVPSQDGKVINFYRFQSNSEYTVPYARLNRKTSNGYLEIWVDSSLNGIDDTSNAFCANGASTPSATEEESCSTSTIGDPSSDQFAWHLDADGDLWTVGLNGTAVTINEFPVQILANGYPSWSKTPKTYNTVPTLFGGGAYSTSIFPTRLWYDTSTHSLFIGGYTTSHPKDVTSNPGVAGGLVGNEMVRYDNWTTVSNPAIACEIVFNTQAAPPQAAGDTSDGVRAFDINAGLIVTGTDFSHRFEYYYGYDTSCNSGSHPMASLQYSWLPGYQVGAFMGTIDSIEVVNLLKDPSTGKWITFTEEGGDMKILMYSYADPNTVPTKP